MCIKIPLASELVLTMDLSVVLESVTNKIMYKALIYFGKNCHY